MITTHRPKKRTPRGGHPFKVIELLVYPTTRPKEARPVPVPLEIHELDALEYRREVDAVALFEFLMRRRA